MTVPSIEQVIPSIGLKVGRKPVLPRTDQPAHCVLTQDSDLTLHDDGPPSGVLPFVSRSVRTQMESPIRTFPQQVWPGKLLALFTLPSDEILP